MQFFPYNIPVTQVASAISASAVPTASYLANFSALPVNTVNTASLALNITGSKGTDGTGQTIEGPKGRRGDRGPDGYRGNSVYVLSASWYDGSPCNPPPTTCTPVIFGSVDIVDGDYYCNYNNILTFYTTSSVFEEGSLLFYNELCTGGVGTISPIGGLLANNRVYATTNNIASNIAPCSNLGF